MPKRSPAVQLDRAIDALLVALQPAPELNPSPVLAQLMPIATALRSLPRPEFKAALKSDLQRRISVNEATAPSPSSPKAANFRRPNFPNIAPYILVDDAARFMDFLMAAFDGTERIRVPKPDVSIMHAEVAIGNSVIELGDANEQYPSRPMTTHLYVPDADATYARALQAGSTPIHAPSDDHPSGDRWGEAKDPFGNTWYIATRKGWTPGPEGALTVQPYLHLRDAHKMIPFAESALGAKATGVHKSAEGLVMHATIEIAGATFEIDEVQHDSQPTQSYLHVYVPDTDAVYDQAVRAGATSVTPPNDAPYGDRVATVRDPFGNTWFLATYLGTSQP
ncbi:MAG: VOC family protein [Candidatus Acidiferrum sp.]